MYMLSSKEWLQGSQSTILGGQLDLMPEVYVERAVEEKESMGGFVENAIYDTGK